MPEPTRPIFENFTQWMKILFYIVAFLTTAAFAVGAAIRIRKYRQGRAAGRLDRPVRRLARTLGLVGANATVARRNVKVGFAHAAILWGFTTLFIGTVILTIDYDLVRTLGGERSSFFEGTFYLSYSFLLDTLGAAYIAGLVYIAWRRRVRKPPALDYARVDREAATYSRKPYARGDWLFWHLLFWLGVGGFLLEGLRIFAHGFPPAEIWSPVGWITARAIRGMGMSRATAADAHLITWWVHGMTALGFVAYIPYSKAMHMLTDVANLTFTEGRSSSAALPRVAEGASLGYRGITDFTWKELLDLDACTKCGRCHEACPARAAGAPLSPRDLILDLRQFAEQASGIHPVLDWERRSDGAAGGNGGETRLAGGIIPAETLWACTTCMACVEACPVGIEHVPTIVQLRRTLVEAGDLEGSLQDALQNIAQQGNSFGQSARTRGKWAKELEFPVKDARRQPVRVLWFVGDYASFDPRLQGLSRSLARVLDDAGVDFGILYDGERNAGNDVRRVGEEGLFEMLAEHNIKTLAGCRFEEIITTDPHTYNTLRNEYPELGGTYTVSHYTEFLARLLDRGQLTPRRAAGIRATYHDPCYLARYNRVTEAPRRILERLGVDLVEMPRNRENTFCCGAGGGRIWMDDSSLAERPSEQRIREAAALDVTHFVVACPKDVTMYRDAAKTTGYDGRIAVVDIVELTEQVVRPEEPAPAAAAAAEA